MESQRLRHLLHQEESTHLEFKSGKSGLPGSLYETICAFLNHDGGDLLIGVEDDGSVSGIKADAAKAMALNIASGLNNPDLIDPPYLLEPSVVDIDGLEILHVSVPQSSRVHRYTKVVYDRGAEGDFKVTSPEAIARMVNRKAGYFSESKVIPGLVLSDLDVPTLQRARGFMRSRWESHPWLALDDSGLLGRAGFIQMDTERGIEGITLAGLMLFGSEESLSRFAPSYMIDCLLRTRQLERYDDRLQIRTNLMDAYGLMLGFVQKHLPDPFFLRGEVRYSLRDLIFRELVANLLVHREYSSGYPGRLIVYADRVEASNPCIPRTHGLLTSQTVVPFQKNPHLSRFFLQLGWVEEVGSGMANVEKWLPLYNAKGRVEFFEDETFTTRVWLPPEGEVTPQVTEQGTEQVTEQGTEQGTEQVERQNRILEYCVVARSREEMMSFLGLSHREHFRSAILQPLLEQGLLAPTLPDKPNSPKQRYITIKGSTP